MITWCHQMGDHQCLYDGRILAFVMIPALLDIASPSNDQSCERFQQLDMKCSSVLPMLRKATFCSPSNTAGHPVVPSTTPRSTPSFHNFAARATALTLRQQQLTLSCHLLVGPPYYCCPFGCSPRHSLISGRTSVVGFRAQRSTAAASHRCITRSGTSLSLQAGAGRDDKALLRQGALRPSGTVLGTSRVQAV